MSEKPKSYNPVDHNPDEAYIYADIFMNSNGYGLDQEQSGFREARNFSTTESFTQLSPDEAWVIKSYLYGVDEHSEYGKLRDYIDEHFIAGVFEKTNLINIPHESGAVLAGVYMGIYWELKDSDTEKAGNVKQRIDALLEYQPESVKDKFANFYIGPKDDPKNN